MKTLLAILCVIASFATVRADESVKEYKKRFSKEGIEELVLSNRFGKIELKQTEAEEIDVQVMMRVVAKSGVKADETLELIQIMETRSGNCLNLETAYGKDMAFKQFMSGIVVTVDYTVMLPKGIKLRIINSDGNVYLGVFEGEVNVDMQNGDFQAEELKGGEFYIKQGKGNFNVQKVSIMDGDFQDCNITIADGDDIRLKTSSCTGALGSLDKLNIRSSGGNMALGDIEELTGSSSFTKYEIQELANILDMNMKMGEMNIRNINVLFSEIRLKGSFTKVGLSFMDDAGYHLEIKRNKSLKMDLPAEMVLEERPTSERNMVVSSKFVGNTKYAGKVFLELSNGNLYIQ